MKSLILSFAVLLLSVSASAKVQFRTFEGNRSLPANMVCPFLHTSAGVESLGGWYSWIDMDGQMSMGNILMSFWSDAIPGSAVCMQSDETFLNLNSYSFDSAVEIEPGECTITTTGNYQLIQSINSPLQVGSAAKVSVKVPDTFLTDVTLINYFVTPEDEKILMYSSEEESNAYAQAICDRLFKL